MNISSAPWQTSNYYQFLYQVQLLQRSNEVPESPGPNTLPHASTYSADRRQLSFKYEKHLAESLAFLAAFNEDPRKVIALCLEEDPGGNALRVRISSNHGSLDEFCKTFEGVSLILRKLAKREMDVAAGEMALLKEVVAINRNRIFIRLRSRHAKRACNFKKKKLAQRNLINTLSQLIKRAFGTSGNEEHYRAMEPLIMAIGTSFKALEEMNVHQITNSHATYHLVDLATSCSRLCHLLQDARPSKILKPLEKEQLEQCKKMARKIGRYQTVAADLAQAARRYHVFRNVSIEQIKLSPIIVSAAAPEEWILLSLGQILTKQQTGKPKVLTNRQLEDAASRWLRDVPFNTFPVHAEVQLLAFLELYPPRLPPRVICSSKKACFLCNKLIKLHGSYFIPSTHGRVYEKWGLPRILDNLPDERAVRMSDAVQGLFLDIENKAKNQPNTAKRAFAVLPESAEGSVISWTSLERSDVTIRAKVSDEHSSLERPDEPIEAEFTCPESTSSRVRLDLPALSEEEDQVTKDDQSSLNTGTAMPAATSHQPSNDANCKSISALWQSLGTNVLRTRNKARLDPDAQIRHVVTLTPTEPATRRLSTSLPVLEIHAGNDLTLYLHYKDDMPAASSMTSSVAYPSAYWVTVELHESAANNEHEDWPTVDVENLAGGVEQTLRIADKPWTGALCIAGKGHRLIVRYHLGAEAR